MATPTESEGLSQRDFENHLGPEIWVNSKNPDTPIRDWITIP